jgi:hydroxymethylpyrimidine kinase/phosphomethylpyrimidine kinase
MNNTSRQRVVLAIGGSDSSGGAGVQLDVRVGDACGVHVATALTAITAQTPMGVSCVEPVNCKLLVEQIKIAFESFDVGAIKIGMLATEDIADAVSSILEKYFNAERMVIVVDPVFSSTSGSLLFTSSKPNICFKRIFSLSNLVTPNLDELATLTGADKDKLESDMSYRRDYAEKFLAYTQAKAALIKGGHGNANPVVDMLISQNMFEFTHPRIVNPIGSICLCHGTGCFVSTFIACRLLTGIDLIQATHEAIAAVSNSIKEAYIVGEGQMMLSTNSIQKLLSCSQDRHEHVRLTRIR